MKLRSIQIVFLASSLVAGGCTAAHYHSKGLRLLRQGRTLEAYAAFEAAFQKNPHSPYSLNNMGYVCEMKYRDYAKAAEYYREALNKCSESGSLSSETEALEELARKNLMRVMIKMEHKSVQEKFRC